MIFDKQWWTSVLPLAWGPIQRRGVNTRNERVLQTSKMQEPPLRVTNDFHFQDDGFTCHFEADYSLGELFFLGNCPDCGSQIALDPKRHTITRTSKGITIVPSLVCPDDELCTWHIIVKDGSGRHCGSGIANGTSWPWPPHTARPNEYPNRHKLDDTPQDIDQDLVWMHQTC